jgi:hypothetical protein
MSIKTPSKIRKGPMKPETSKVTKQPKEDASTTVISTPAAAAKCNALLPYTPEPQDIIIELTNNPNKVDVMQPSLLGSCKFGELDVRLAFWFSETKLKDRTYYSCACHDALKKKQAWENDRKTIEPLHKLKFYEFRKTYSSDPDFDTKECFIEAGASWWGAMWVILPEDPDALDLIRYFVVFSSKPFREAMSAQAKENAALGVARLLQRRKELETDTFWRAETAKQSDGDDIPGLD